MQVSLCELVDLVAPEDDGSAEVYVFDHTLTTHADAERARLSKVMSLSRAGTLDWPDARPLKVPFFYSFLIGHGPLCCPWFSVAGPPRDSCVCEPVRGSGD